MKFLSLQATASPARPVSCHPIRPNPLLLAAGVRVIDALIRILTAVAAVALWKYVCPRALRAQR